LPRSEFYLWYKEFPFRNQNICVYLFTTFIFLAACLVAVEFLEVIIFQTRHSQERQLDYC
jgi:hypothetical protein